ncbi:FAD-dependent monooxygenase [Nonomuraea sp. bgisy101]|uniref:FAD-dependent monooxygenase n=1 Tax=Nonomuraea sp. bgisy101 TaxID=3413784 RepID=UPI003D731940
MNILISGASVSGPVLAYWLKRHGFTPTVVEKAPTLRKSGGHAVDLFKPAMDIVERMGALDAIMERKTGTEWITMIRRGTAKPVNIQVSRLMGGISARHVEIMRDDLSEVLYDATKDDVEYVFGDSITSISDDGEVTFERGAPRRFDLVIGADGLHSNVRRLVFGPESSFTHWLGAYIAVATIPNYLDLGDRMAGMPTVGRMVGVYSARHMDDARAFFFMRPAGQLDYHYRDTARQKELLREQFADLGWETPRLLDEMDRAEVFYFDSVTQLRMDTWSRGRVTLVGDAGYCPGPAVGGSTSIAVVGAYVLAGELAKELAGGQGAARGDHSRAFAAYESEMSEYVRRSRDFAMTAAKRLIPGSGAEVWALINGARLFTSLPTRLTRAITRRGGGNLGMHDTFEPKDYGALTPAHPPA